MLYNPECVCEAEGILYLRPGSLRMMRPYTREGRITMRPTSISSRLDTALTCTRLRLRI